ncbi:hypothetical protein DIE15_01620 [Burkholderia sp. Bp9031]|nr:hypothetical protein DIE15_01620 [Burkholderia sp. Bp9031]
MRGLLASGMPMRKSGRHASTRSLRRRSMPLIDEWEALAPYPDHLVHAAHTAHGESLDIYPPFGRRDEPAQPDSLVARRPRG